MRLECKGCRYHRAKAEMCRRYTDIQTDDYAYRTLCRGRDKKVR